jgi:hypothetical protein
VSAERRIRLWSLVVDHAGGTPVEVRHVGYAATFATGVDATAIAVILAASPRETVYTSSQIAADMEELTMTLGEGPGVDALAGGIALAGDLSEAWCRDRWPVFAAAAVDGGVRAAFALPLRVGGIRLGVMDLYRALPGDLDQMQLADALLLADTACALLLDSTQHRASPDGTGPEEASLQHPEVHQATGMIIAQLEVSSAVALIWLRAYAYAHSRRLRDVAADIVARRLRLPADADGDIGGNVHGDR